MGGHPAPRSFASSVGPKMWLAALPLFVGYTLAAITMNAALAPASQDHEELRLERSPAGAPPAAPPVQSSPSHREEIVFDPSEMISV
jgi:hypothetical protein